MRKFLMQPVVQVACVLPMSVSSCADSRRFHRGVPPKASRESTVPVLISVCALHNRWRKRSSQRPGRVAGVAVVAAADAATGRRQASAITAGSNRT